ncbi:MAG: dihydroorotate dehydrogenase electron transfer subunit [Candidatus Aadella gelida]|nr:dihydroorotate dehydrogenase electron transfer subunit [Candidatus Aadella gelida]
MKKVIKGIIKENKNVGADHFRITVEEPHISSTSCPGQFVNIKIGDSGSSEHLLRIPLGVHTTRKNETSFLYKVVGEGTRELSRRKKGETLDVLGPLGKGFDISGLEEGSCALIAGGGHGAAPLYGLVESLTKKNIKTVFFMGACSGDHIVLEDEIKNLGAELIISTDDGSCGTKGYVTESLEKHLTRDPRPETRETIYACGPNPMLKEVARIAETYKIPAQTSIDEYMACGIGACLGCAVKTKNGYKLACKDGPVFDAQEIVW